MLGAELRAIRKRQGISQQTLAEHADISRSAYSKIETGVRYPTLRSLEGICECLGITVVVGPTDTVIDGNSR